MPRARANSSQSQGAKLGKRQRGPPSKSQPTIEQSFHRSQVPIDIDELVKKCVKYVLYRAGNQLPLRKADIQKHVLQGVGRSFDQIMAQVIATLKDVYGYDLYESGELGVPKQYLVGTTLPYKAGLGAEQPPQDQSEDEADDSILLPPERHKIIIMHVLMHIFMSNNNVSEPSLMSYLRTLHIDPEETHELFGNVKNFVKSTMVKQKYLSTVTEKVSQKVCYSWGPRSEHEVSKHAILKLISNKVYKKLTPNSWVTQYANAKEQSREEEEEPAVEDQENAVDEAESLMED